MLYPRNNLPMDHPLYGATEVRVAQTVLTRRDGRWFRDERFTALGNDKVKLTFLLIEESWPEGAATRLIRFDDEFPELHYQSKAIRGYVVDMLDNGLLRLPVA